MERWRRAPAWLALSLLAAPAALAAAAVLAPRAQADARMVVREDSWSLGRKPPVLATLVRTEVKGLMRRLENEIIAGPADSLRKAARHVQIDRVDRDTSYYFRPDAKAYLTVGFTSTRASNLRRAASFRRARVLGEAPRDTIPPVETRALPGRRTILGVPCRGYVVALRFAYRDSAAVPGETLHGLLADTVWVASPGSPADELDRFERAFARATAADSFLAAPNAVQLAQAPGQGLVSVLTRAVRQLPGVALESSYANVLYGVPSGMTGVERLPDGGVIVQRTHRRAVELSGAPVPGERFDVPPGYQRLGAGVTAAP